VAPQSLSAWHAALHRVTAMAKSSTPHDALFKATFSNEVDAAAALQGILNPAIVKLVDWQSLTLCPGSFVDDSLAQAHSDLLAHCQSQAQQGFTHTFATRDSRASASQRKWLDRPHPTYQTKPCSFAPGGINPPPHGSPMALRHSRPFSAIIGRLLPHFRSSGFFRSLMLIPRPIRSPK
jgi:hypothetical protein